MSTALMRGTKQKQMLFYMCRLSLVYARQEGIHLLHYQFHFIWDIVITIKHSGNVVQQAIKLRWVKNVPKNSLIP